MNNDLVNNDMPPSELLGLIYESMPDGVVGFDLQGRILYCNPPMALMVGQPVHSLVGKTAKQAWGEERDPETDGTAGQFSEKRLRCPNGKTLIVRAKTFAASGDPSIQIVIYRDLTQSRQHERMLHHILESTAASTGKSFFRSLAGTLARALQANYCIIAEFRDSHQKELRTLAFWNQGSLAEDFNFSVARSPVKRLLSDRAVHYTHEVWNHFPEDDLLGRLRIQAYSGALLTDSQGQPLGMLSVMHDDPLPDSQDTTSIVKLFALRAGAEIERQRGLQALHESERRFRTLMEYIPKIGVYGFDRRHRINFWNKACENLYGYTKVEALGQKVEDLIVPERHKNRVLTGIENWIKNGERLPTGEIDLKRKDGSLVCVYSSHEMLQTTQGDINIYTLDIDMTDLKEAEEALRESETRYRQLVEMSPMAMFVLQDHKIAFANRSAIKMLNARTHTDIINKDFQEWIHPSCHKQYAQMLEHLLEMTNNPHQSVFSQELECQLLRPDGNILDVEATLIPILYEGASAVQIIVQNLTERKQQEKALRESEERYALASRGANDGLWDWNLETGVVYYSSRWKEMFGLEPDEIGETLEDWLSRVHPDDVVDLRLKLDTHLKQMTPHFEAEARMRHKDSSYRWTVARGEAIFEDNGRPVRMAGSLRDITERKLAEEQLQHHAFHDRLTGLANRLLFMEHLQRSLDRSKRIKNSMFAVLFIDIDRFKIVTDSLGHSIADQLLVDFARRMKNISRPGDLCARLEGDEFAMLLEDLQLPGEARELAESMQTAMSKPFDVRGHEIFVNTSIGIAFCAGQYDNPEDILRDGDTAMHRAKLLGKAQRVEFDSEMRETVRDFLRMETELRKSIERLEFEVYYQPIVDLHDGRIVSFEALLRWQHPKGDIVMPNEFIPLAEETGVILPLGMLVLQQASLTAADWRRQFGERAPSISVNISTRQLLQSDMLAQLDDILKSAELDPALLKMELTESVIMEHEEIVLELLNQIKQRGIQLCIDDFGTGYSSLSKLHHLPFDTLKIDRSFLSGAHLRNDGSMMLSTIVSLAHNLGMNVVAEGVEQDGIIELLRRLGCEYAQGYTFSQPICAEEATKLLESGHQFITPQ
ncbi:EAL domain-containing protein [Candidatus Sumerlaeota bacterium]|nr:EAL domain-containing protein [Candidatus Sumerlaeota bacterium]